MDEQHGDHLLLWGLATFHATALALLLALIVYRVGNLGDALHNIGTLPGVALFVALWIGTSWTTRRAVRGSGWELHRAPPVETLLRRGAGWGGVNGVIFFVCLDAYVALSALVAGRLSDVASGLGFFAATSVTGSIPAFFVGATIGMLFAAIDLVLIEVARRIAVDSAKDTETR